MGKYKVTADSLYVRDEPKPTGQIVGVLKKNEEVEVVSISGDGYWHKVERGDLKGWSSHKYMISLENDGDLSDEEFPWMKYAIRELGVKEFAGVADNPRVVEYLSSTNLGVAERNNDETYWCSAFVNWCVEKAGYAGTDSAWARSWEHWGKKITSPRRGCIVVFKRPCRRGDTVKRCGHIGFYVGSSGTKVKVLGGNQADKVSYDEFLKSDVLSYRVPG
jgi:uncharacterized protein (TIGR02594 family)